jgi:hypothetical protein
MSGEFVKGLKIQLDSRGGGGIWWKPVEGLEITSERALALITGKAEASNALEDVFKDENANTMLPKEESASTGTTRTFQRAVEFVPPTFVAMVSRALEEKEDRD